MRGVGGEGRKETDRRRGKRKEERRRVRRERKKYEEGIEIRECK